MGPRLTDTDVNVKERGESLQIEAELRHLQVLMLPVFINGVAVSSIYGLEQPSYFGFLVNMLTLFIPRLNLITCGVFRTKPIRTLAKTYLNIILGGFIYPGKYLLSYT